MYFSNKVTVTGWMCAVFNFVWVLFYLPFFGLLHREPEVRGFSAFHWFLFDFFLSIKQCLCNLLLVLNFILHDGGYLLQPLRFLNVNYRHKLELWCLCLHFILFIVVIHGYDNLFLSNLIICIDQCRRGNWTDYCINRRGFNYLYLTFCAH